MMRYGKQCICLQVKRGQASLVRLDPYGGTNPLGMFHLFLKRNADVISPRLSVVFRRLVRLVSFSAFRTQANVTPIPKGPPSFSVANYRPVSLTSALSKVFESLVSARLGRFIECSGLLPTTKFAYWKGLGTMHFCVCPLYCKVHWGVGRRLGLCRLFSAQPFVD